MAKIKPIIIIALFAIITIIVAGCTTEENQWNYFPNQTGTEWNYKIMLSGEPIRYTEALMYSNGGIYCTRDFYNDKDVTTHYLKFRITGVNSNPKSLSYDEVKNIKIIEDTLGVFSNNAGAAIAKKDDTAFLLLAHKIDVLSPDYLLTERLLFFTGDVDDTLIKSHKGILSPDGLSYSGMDTNVPGYEGQKCMHFTRLVKFNLKNGLNGHHQIGTEKDFTEDTWFAKDKGLIRLEQKIDGKISMIWTLEKFIKG
ncbi:MAG: hypothetical protein PHD31_00765 [Candidatus Pacebacteria bacterium]|nr:hypothetical protein [Candidatus Paceibacterota bacterium]